MTDLEQFYYHFATYKGFEKLLDDALRFQDTRTILDLEAFENALQIFKQKFYAIDFSTIDKKLERVKAKRKKDAEFFRSV